MSTKNDGGAAFPAINGRDGPHSYPLGTSGLTLRDYFAARAMDQALSHYPCEIWNQSQDILSGTEFIDDAARSAYAIADAMIRARSS